MPADPTYPLFPVFSIVGAALMLVMFTTNVIRHSWNVGVSFLCFWLFWELLTFGVNAIIWSDNADIKLVVYCDIGASAAEFTTAVKPACTLIITRRLYKIASLRSLEYRSRKERIADLTIEWSLGLGLPFLVASGFYYVVQGGRFQIWEGYGCSIAEYVSITDILLIVSWNVTLPIFSLLFYCPKIFYVFYRHKSEADDSELIESGVGSISRPSYFRILAIGCLDIVFTLPFGIISIVEICQGPAKPSFFPGWTAEHSSSWAPNSNSYAFLKAGGPWELVLYYYFRWYSVALAFSIFALFGLSPDARATYWQGICAARKLGGWAPSCGPQEPGSETIVFRPERPNNSSVEYINSQPVIAVAFEVEADFAKDGGLGRESSTLPGTP